MGYTGLYCYSNKMIQYIYNIYIYNYIYIYTHTGTVSAHIFQTNPHIPSIIVPWPRFVHASKDVQAQMLKDPAVARVRDLDGPFLVGFYGDSWGFSQGLNQPKWFINSLSMDTHTQIYIYIISINGFI